MQISYLAKIFDRGRRDAVRQFLNVNAKVAGSIFTRGNKSFYFPALRTLYFWWKKEIGVS